MADLIVLIPIFYIALISIPLAITDIREHRLPNPMTVSAIALTLICLIVPLVLIGSIGALGGLISGGLTFLIGYLLARRDAIGMGDVKLLTSLNAVAAYFWPLLPVVSTTAGLVLASITSLGLVFLKKTTLKASLPLGPYLLVGFFLCVGPAAISATAEALS